jgi:PAS domain S-box-containing protein
MSNKPKNNELPDDNDELNFVDEDDDELDLLDEDEPYLADEADNDEFQLPVINPTAKTWKVIIVDDDEEIHEVTRFALTGFVFKNKPLTFFSAYSVEEAKSLFKAHPDTALVFLDVVMEENDSGLQLVKYIRHTLKNNIVRIILRTGQPGEAPEEEVIVNYDINDYKLKVELTQRKLFVTMIAGLRAYYDLMTIDVNKTALTQTLEGMPVGVYVLKAPDGEPIYFNQRAIHILGKGIEKGVTVDNIAEVYQLYKAGTSQLYSSNYLPSVCALKGESTHVDDMEIHQAGKVIPVETWGTPISDEKGKIIYALIAFQDITERKQAEADKIRLVQEREAKNAALRYNQEIESKNAELLKLNQEKNEFLGIAAHDLKNPLSTIQGFAELILSDSISSKKEILEFVDHIEKSSHQMFDLITNLLDVNRIESGKLNIAPMNINILPTVSHLVKSYTERAKAKDITLHFEASEAEYLVFFDQSALHQVLDNLISNAVKYSHRGKNVFIRLSKNDKVVRCEIQDEGPGLSSEEQDKLFGKFTRLSPKPTGGENSTGLGLFIVKKLLETMKGKVWCESEDGKGATFIITLPV